MKESGADAEPDISHVGWALWGSPLVWVLGQGSCLCFWLGKTSCDTGELWYQSKVKHTYLPHV